MSVEVKLKNGEINYSFDLIFIPTHRNRTIEWSIKNFICERLFSLKDVEGDLQAVIKAPQVIFDYFDAVEPNTAYHTPTKVKGIYLGSIYDLRNENWKSFFLHYSEEHDSMIISEHYANISNDLNTNLYINVNLLVLPVPIHVLLTNIMKGIKYINISSDM